MFVLSWSSLGAACGGGSASPQVQAPQPPAITTQPAAASVVAPAEATYTVAATGTPPLAYQWRRNGTPIAGATGPSYSTGPTLLADSGAVFSATVSNAAGSVATAGATLTVTLPPPGSLVPGSLVHGGVARSYLRYVPDRLPSTPVALMVVLHGGGDDAEATASESRATRAWRDLADVDKFVVVYPNGIDSRWRDCRSDAALRPAADDVGFISALVDRISAELPIDARRIYVSGSSNGGMMAYRIGLELSTRVAGIAGVISNLPTDPSRECPARPARPLSVVVMDGTADPLMPFAGGTVAGPGGGTVLSTAATRDYWLAANGCPTAATVESFPDATVADGGTVTREVYRPCSGGHAVALYRVDGGGHDMPSLRYFSGSPRQNRDVEGADQIWRVLKNARRD